MTLLGKVGNCILASEWNPVNADNINLQEMFNKTSLVHFLDRLKSIG